jgi:hypothetical protein
MFESLNLEFDPEAYLHLVSGGTTESITQAQFYQESLVL